MGSIAPKKNQKRELAVRLIKVIKRLAHHKSSAEEKANLFEWWSRLDFPQKEGFGLGAFAIFGIGMMMAGVTGQHPTWQWFFVAITILGAFLIVASSFVAIFSYTKGSNRKIWILTASIMSLFITAFTYRSVTAQDFRPPAILSPAILKTELNVSFDSKHFALMRLRLMVRNDNESQIESWAHFTSDYSLAARNTETEIYKSSVLVYYLKTHRDDPVKYPIEAHSSAWINADKFTLSSNDYNLYLGGKKPLYFAGEIFTDSVQNPIEYCYIRYGNDAPDGFSFCPRR